ncbi:hypothetical protein TIFTF001_035935 [Ficus carica]|uniref:Uncharacterized protein n=1 Tax=Ficus carica TaxID=3494 RepID=A0AA88JAL4_FICCA|nr:hypothetical protein TIFTF001_035935 [Ficus carica]
MQELCAKHGINRETMAEEATAPTIDQHNSFKASCTLNEKEADASDPQPMPNASKECQLFLTDLITGGDVLVAIGRAYMDCVPIDTVHGIPLGEGNGTKPLEIAGGTRNNKAMQLQDVDSDCSMPYTTRKCAVRLFYIGVHVRNNVERRWTCLTSKQDFLY